MKQDLIMKKRQIMGNNNLIELSVNIVYETDKAIKVTDGIITEWIAKSQIEDIKTDNEISVIVLPEWIAKTKGFV